MHVNEMRKKKTCSWSEIRKIKGSNTISKINKTTLKNQKMF